MQAYDVIVCVYVQMQLTVDLGAGDYLIYAIDGIVMLYVRNQNSHNFYR